MKTLLKNFTSACLALASLALTTHTAANPIEQPPTAWDAWAKWVEKSHPITDSQGHGPDIGGNEWSHALNQRLQITNPSGHALEIGSHEWRTAVEKKLKEKITTAPHETRKLLSSHRTEARFDGIADHRCRGRTSLCPDECGDSGKLATFTILQYLDHQKSNGYGDPKQKRFQILIEDNHQNSKVPAAIRATILTLKPGDRVRLDWNHDCITRAGSQFPQRPIVALTKIPAQP
jgi:hypothetical protein